MGAAKKKEKMPKSISKVYEEVSKRPLLETWRMLRLDCICFNNDMDEVPSPSFVLNFREKN